MYRIHIYLIIPALFLILMPGAGIFAADINIVSDSLEFSQGKIVYSLDAKGEETLIKSVVLQYWLGKFPDSGSKMEKVFKYEEPVEEVQARFKAPLVQSTYFSVPQIYFYKWVNVKILEYSVCYCWLCGCRWNNVCQEKGVTPNFFLTLRQNPGT